MLTKRLLTDEELDTFINLRETKGDAAASRYMKTLQSELFHTEDPETKQIKNKKYESKPRK